eukprot:scaffold85_cov358-Pavlova_lutheri.AAC.44
MGTKPGRRIDPGLEKGSPFVQTRRKKDPRVDRKGTNRRDPSRRRKRKERPSFDTSVGPSNKS